MTEPMTDPVKVADTLSEAQRDFLERVCTGRKLGLASRAEDKVRQSLRRMGLVHVAQEPRRWEPLPFGLAVREILLARGEGRG